MNATALIERDKPPAPAELKRLFSETSWAKDRSIDAIRKMLQTPAIMVCVREKGVLIGFGRIITDFCFRGLLDDIIVSEGHRGRGHGKAIIRELVAAAEGIDEVFLNTGIHLDGLYAEFGFTKFLGHTMVRKPGRQAGAA